MIEAAPETRSPSAFNTLDLSEPAHPIDQDNGGRDGCRLLRIEVSGTKDGKLVYELEIPESLVRALVISLGGHHHDSPQDQV